MDEDRLKFLLKESKEEMPFSDFESRVMASVYKEEKGKNFILRNIRLSWLFFTIGTLFGIFATALLPLIKQQLFHLDIRYFQIPVLLIITGVLIWQMETLLKFTFRNVKKRLK